MNYYARFTLGITLMTAIFHPLVAMEESTQETVTVNKTKEEEELQPIVWTPGKTFELSDTPRKKTTCCLWRNKVRIITLLSACGAAYGAYWFFSLLSQECTKMKSSCDTCSSDFAGIHDKLEFLENATQFILQFLENCPRTVNDFQPILLDYVQRCCLEQPWQEDLAQVLAQKQQ